MKRTVIKVGGSVLFSDQNLKKLIDSLMSNLLDAQVLFVVGGGEVVESMRLLHQYRPELPQGWIHWECVRLMDTTVALASELVPDIELIEDSNQLREFCGHEQPKAAWVSTQAFYTREIVTTFRTEYLPAENWDTTSDTIAWVLARTVQAEELILLKSCATNAITDLVTAAEQGIIDTELARLAPSHSEIQIRLISCNVDQSPRP